MFDEQYDTKACFNDHEKARQLFAKLQAEITPSVFLDNPDITMRHAWYDVYTALGSGRDTDVVEAVSDAYCACEWASKDWVYLDKLESIVQTVYHYVHAWDD